MTIPPYVVYIFVVIANQVMCVLNGFDFITWQNLVWSGLIILSFIAGCNYKKED